MSYSVICRTGPVGSHQFSTTPFEDLDQATQAAEEMFAAKKGDCLVQGVNGWPLVYFIR